jgi:hypothetical protein
MTVTDTRGSSYTHRDWKHETGNVLLVVAAAEKALEQMEASLAEVRAGNTHRALVSQCQIRGAEILRSGLDLVDATDQRYLPVHEAIQAAGGKDEVAHVKTYHQA